MLMVVVAVVIVVVIVGVVSAFEMVITGAARRKRAIVGRREPFPSPRIVVEVIVVVPVHVTRVVAAHAPRPLLL